MAPSAQPMRAQPSRYNLWIVSPPNYIHSRCFAEVALSLRDGLRALGHDSDIVTSSFDCPPGKDAWTIILGAHLLCHSFIDPISLPRNMIIYNLEQITPGSPWLTEQYLGIMQGKWCDGEFLSKGHQIKVWDYSKRNIDELKQLGIEATLCEIGYMPSLTRIAPCDEDIDVLFVGSMNRRRAKIIEDLTRAGLKVVPVFGYYGAERDLLIARAKVVLNVHFYDSKVFEIVRCSYLMANKKCVVSEWGSDQDLEEYYNNGIVFCPYDGLVWNCRRMVGDEKQRNMIAQNGFELFSNKSQVEILKGVL